MECIGVVVRSEEILRKIEIVYMDDALWDRAFIVIFFFKKKTAYEVRISDWSADVCSSDLAATEAGDDAKIWWDLHITPSGGVKFVALEGPFTVKAGVTE